MPTGDNNLLRDTTTRWPGPSATRLLVRRGDQGRLFLHWSERHRRYRPAGPGGRHGKVAQHSRRYRREIDAQDAAQRGLEIRE